MKKSNIILVGLGYLAGLVVATKFAKPGTSKSLGEIGEELGTIHKNLWTEAETRLFSPENRDRIASMKSEAIRDIKLFQEEGEVFVSDLMKK